MGRNILVVEDDRNICDLIHMYLVKEGFDVRIAYSFFCFYFLQFG